MGAVDEILSDIDLNQLANVLGTDPSLAEEAVRQAVPELFNGLQANIAEGGSMSLAEALTEHADNGLLDGGVDLDAVDVTDGEKIVQHIFGNDPSQIQALGSRNASSPMGGLMKQLLPILAPIVMAYLAKRLGVGSSRSNQSSASSGGLGDLLGPILGGILGGGKGGMLGGGQQTQTQQPTQTGGGDILGQILAQILAGGGAGMPQTDQGGGFTPQSPSGDTSGPFQNYPGEQSGNKPRIDMSDSETDEYGQPRQQGNQQGGTIGDILGQIFGR